MVFDPTCPICRRRVSWKDNLYRPFCSERCKLVDLGAWVEERYRLPGEDVSDGDETGESEEGENNGQR